MGRGGYVKQGAVPPSEWAQGVYTLTHTYSSHPRAVPRTGPVNSLLRRATGSQRGAFHREMPGLELPGTHKEGAAGPGTRGGDRVGCEGSGRSCRPSFLLGLSLPAASRRSSPQPADAHSARQPPAPWPCLAFMLMDRSPASSVRAEVLTSSSSPVSSGPGVPRRGAKESLTS